MKTRINYGEIAEKIDYTKLGKKLDELRKQEPPNKRRRAADMLAPVRDNLLELHRMGWTYAKLGEALKEAGALVAVGTLRDYLGGGHRGKSKPGRRGSKPRGGTGSAGGNPAAIDPNSL